MDNFETYRPLLFSIAYRMLGSAMDAEDIVQEAYLRYQTVSTEQITHPKAFLSTIVTRLCLNHLQSARVQREQYLGPWLPEPLLTVEEAPSSRLQIHETLSMAFLVLLEQLTPQERAVFLLREVFEYDYAEIAAVIDKSEVTCRQLLSRAKKHIADNRPRFKSSPEEHAAMLARFLKAIEAGELEGLMHLLAEDVTLWADGGGKIPGAATRPIHGRQDVARFLVGISRFAPQDYYLEITQLNGQVALIIRNGSGTAFVVVTFQMLDTLISVFHIIGNPDKLGHL